MKKTKKQSVNKKFIIQFINKKTIYFVQLSVIYKKNYKLNNKNKIKFYKNFNVLFAKQTKKYLLLNLLYNKLILFVKFRRYNKKIQKNDKIYNNNVMYNIVIN